MMNLYLGNLEIHVEKNGICTSTIEIISSRIESGSCKVILKTSASKSREELNEKADILIDNLALVLNNLEMEKLFGELTRV